METSTTTEVSSLQSTSASNAPIKFTNFWSAQSAGTNAFTSTNGPLKLTLSAYCRPEDTVRLTDACPKELIHTKYELLDPSRCRTLGHGASSTVRLAYRRSDGAPVAIKTIAKHDALGMWSKTNRWRIGARRNMVSPRDSSGEMKKDLQKRQPRLEEVDVLTSLKGECPNIVQLLDVYETHQEVQLVLEYCEGGDLFDCIKTRKQIEMERGCGTLSQEEPLIHGSFTEQETATVAKTLLKVLHTLHSRHIVHRDIKPENILLVEEDDCMGELGRVKLTDFGLARLLHNDDTSSKMTSSSGDSSSSSNQDFSKQRSRAYSRVGSDYYAAPEVMMGAGYDTPVDIYSLGVTLYVMLCGTPPSSTSFFKTENADLSDEESTCCMASVSDESTESSSSGSEIFPSELKISSLAQDLIIKLIHPDPEKRIVASEALKHEWILMHTSDEEETHKMTHITSKLSLTASHSSNDGLRKRTLSFAETESFLRIGPTLPVKPPSNSPTLKLSQLGLVSLTPSEMSSRPTTPNQESISLTLADVCNKLAPLVDEQQLHKQRKHRRRSLSHGDKACFASSKKHSRGVSGSGRGEKQNKKKRMTANSKKKRAPEMISSPSYANNRIGLRTFNSPIQSPFRRLLSHHSKSPE